MRTLSKKGIGRVFAHVVGSATNLIIAGLLVASVMTMRERMAWRWVDSTTTLASSIEAEEPIYPDPATLSFIDRAEEADKLPASSADADEEWLARAIYFEARNEPTEGQAEVAKVVLNRLDDPRWPKSVKAVVSQGEAKRNRCQFSFMCDGKPEQIEDERAWRRALRIAKDVLTDWRSGADMGCAHSYRADYVTSPSALRWFATLRKEKQKGRHIFYCDTRS